MFSLIGRTNFCHPGIVSSTQSARRSGRAVRLATDSSVASASQSSASRKASVVARFASSVTAGSGVGTAFCAIETAWACGSALCPNSPCI
jgi:hypothetical protein